jgi:spermidine/putrescine transport system substrate-binding protein
VEGLVNLAGLYTGAKDPWLMTDEELAKAREALLEQKPLLRMYWSSQTDLEQAFASGEVVAANGWNASVALLRKQGLDMALMNPKEGMVTWTDGLVMMPGAPEELAYEFMNAYMTPDVGVFLITSYGYGSGNTKAYGQVPKERLVELGIDEPAEIIAKTWFQREIDPAVQPKYQEVYDEIKLS